ncbi:MAG: acyl-CoA dehydrogenase, partial [Burkholderiales bacterium]
MDAAATLTPELVAQLQAWQGRSETLHDEITAAPVRNLSATLDRADPEPVRGTELPPLWH